MDRADEPPASAFEAPSEAPAPSTEIAPFEAPPPVDVARGGPRASVYRLTPTVDVPVIAAAGIFVGVTELSSEQIVRTRCPCSVAEVNAFDRFAIGNESALARAFSDITVLAAMSVPLALDAVELGFREPLLEDAVVLVETLAVNTAVGSATKLLVQRPRPRTYAGDPTSLKDPQGYQSFFSGHTSTAFAALTAASITMRMRYGEQYWPWAVTVVVGATDVITGALAGSAIGVLVPLLHVRHAGDADRVAITPIDDGAVVSWGRAF